jgi:DNA polymerase-1
MQTSFNFFEEKHLPLHHKAIIVDSHSIIYRAYYGIPLLSNSHGEPTNAIYGFFSSFLKAVKIFQPNFIVVAFDSSGPTFRHQEYLDYKATRKKMPLELKKQIVHLKKILQKINIFTCEKQGFEGDDIIGTISRKISQEKKSPDLDIIILSGDLDLLQLIREKVKLCLLNKGINNFMIYNKEDVKAKYSGIEPGQLNDMKALKGDSSDNIPGVPGVGEKTAIKLINQFHNLENLYQQIENYESEKTKTIKPVIKKKLVEFQHQAFFSRKLCEIREDVPLNFNLEDCHWQEEKNRHKVISAMKQLEFYSLIKRL